MARFNFKVRANRHELDEVDVVRRLEPPVHAERVPRQWIAEDQVVRQFGTEEGAPAFLRSPRLELFLLAVSHMVGGDTFYERADERADRFRELVRTVAV